MNKGEVVETYELYHLPRDNKVGLGKMSIPSPTLLGSVQALIDGYVATGSYKVEDFEIRKIVTTRVQ